MTSQSSAERSEIAQPTESVAARNEIALNNDVCPSLLDTLGFLKFPDIQTLNLSDDSTVFTDNIAQIKEELENMSKDNNSSDKSSDNNSIDRYSDKNSDKNSDVKINVLSQLSRNDGNSLTRSDSLSSFSSFKSTIDNDTASEDSSTVSDLTDTFKSVNSDSDNLSTNDNSSDNFSTSDNASTSDNSSDNSSGKLSNKFTTMSLFNRSSGGQGKEKKSPTNSRSSKKTQTKSTSQSTKKATKSSHSNTDRQIFYKHKL